MPKKASTPVPSEMEVAPIPAAPVPSEITGHAVPPDGGETATPGGGGDGQSHTTIDLYVQAIPDLRFEDEAGNIWYLDEMQRGIFMLRKTYR